MQIPATHYLPVRASARQRTDVEYTHGWGDYFDYDIVNIFIFVILIMFGSVIFAQEKVSGFLPIVRSARYGRTRTAFAKIAVMGLLTVGIVLLFTFTTWGIYGLELGYSSPSNAIQLSGVHLPLYIITVVFSRRCIFS